MNCEYNLAGLPPEGLCPECGHRIDDSIRARGLWTAARLRRLRMVTIAFVVGSFAWLPLALLISGQILARGRLLNAVDPQVAQSCAAIAVLIHAGMVAFAAIGGTFASSRQGYHRRMAISLGLSLVLVIAAGCFAAAIGGSRPLQRAFEDWGFIASGLVRTAGISLGFYWIMLGVQQSTLAVNARRAIGMIFLRGYPLAWSAFLVALAIPSLQQSLVRGPAELVLGAFLLTDAIALVVIGLVVQSVILSERFVAPAARNALEGDDEGRRPSRAA